jgi:hypothetical protein
MENDRQMGPAWFGPEIDSSDDRWWLWDVTVTNQNAAAASDVRC